MIETLKLWDTSFFLLLNGQHTPLFDGVMLETSWKLSWIPFYISILYMVIRQWKKDSVWIILALIACVTIADQVSSGIIKDLVQRPRPSHTDGLNAVIHLVKGYRGGHYGFVSSHAANAFGFALLSSLLFRRKSYIIAIFTWAMLTAYSRVYLGVHYPLDILGGMLVGALSALVCYSALIRFRPQILRYNTVKQQTALPVTVLILSFVVIFVYSFFWFQ